MLKITATVGLIALAATSAQAQSQKPGLWEHSSNTQARGGEMAQQLAEMKKQMAALPPEQRKAMEQMMGMSVTSDGQTMTVKHCITPEEAAKAFVPSHDDECKYTITQRSATSIKAKFVCSDEGRSSGEGEYQYKGDTAYSGRFSVTTMVNGKPERMEMTQSGKWLSAQCGNVKPANTPPPKGK
jgi:Protein of unknown function (DUF3617)